jgi:ABC-type Na+ efflux pump permease subunit
MASTRRVLLVAGEELTRYFRGFNKRVLLFVAATGLVAALLLPGLMQRGVVPDQGIYRAEVSPGGALEGPARADRQLQIVPGLGNHMLAGDVDLSLLDTRVHYSDTERGRAAVHDFAEFAKRYYDVELNKEPNQGAAFPVRVNLLYSPRSVQGAFSPVRDFGSVAGIETGYQSVNQSVVLGQAGEPHLALVPGRVEPPFPMRSLLLTFVYLVPLNFVGQYYAGSLLAERTRRRGVLLLSTPMTGPQVLLGKTLPYLGFAVLFGAVATLFLGSGLLGFLAVLPVFSFFLIATCFGALVARSYRELTFLITTMSVALSTYLFLPAIFTQVHPIAFISPISVVAAQIRHEHVPLLSFLYSITPLSLAALVLGLLSGALYREETLFAPRRVTSKLMDALQILLPHARTFFFAGLLAIPFVFGAELFVLAFAASLPPGAAVGVFLLGVALVEEIAKSLPSLAHYRRSSQPRSPWTVGALIGMGFFLGEKISILFALIGLDLLPLGQTLLASTGVTTSLLLIFAPLALHVVTSWITSHAARAGRWMYLLGLLVAMLVHTLYNWTVIRNV